MSHASDLPRQLFLYLASVVIPDSFSRYFYHFLMLFVGSLGVYFLLKNLILKEFEEGYLKIVSLIGALFYLLNLGTVQYFYVPYEAFSHFWGFLPWLIYVTLNYLHQKTKLNLVLFLVINFLATPLAYVQTFFIVYILVLGVLFLIDAIQKKSNTSILHFLTKNITQYIKIFVLIFLINAYWIFPNAYFVATNLDAAQDAIQNKLESEVTFEQNRFRGNFLDFALLKGYYYDLASYDIASGESVFLMNDWREYYQYLHPNLIGLFFFGLCIAGLFYKSKYRFHLLALFLLCCVIFLSNTIIFSFLNDLLRSVPIVNQIFRSPFTKFIAPAQLVFAIAISIAVLSILQRLKQRSKNLPIIFSVVVIALLFIQVLPLFKGQFISPRMRISIPSEYFELFAYFKTQDKSARIMNLPQNSFWEWNFYRFGSFGSGFIWYGIEQPITDRIADTWNRSSENYYWQLSYALKKRDKELFNEVIEKYQIKFILLDENIIYDNSLASDRTIYNQKDLLKNNKKVTFDKRFGSVSVYKTNLENSPKNNIKVLTNLSNIRKDDKYENIDEAFQKFDHYYSKDLGDIHFPFNSLFTGRFPEEKTFEVKEESDRFILTSPIIPRGDYDLNLPFPTETESLIPIEISARLEGNGTRIKATNFLPKLLIDSQNINTLFNPKEFEFDVSLSTDLILSVNGKDFFAISNLPKNGEYKFVGYSFLINSNQANSLKVYDGLEKSSVVLDINKFKEGGRCSGDTEGSFNSKIDNGLTLDAEGTAVCSVYGENLEVSPNNLINIEYEYQSETDEFPEYCLFSQSAKRCLNPKETEKFGFSNTPLKVSEHFENVSPTQEKADFSFILEAFQISGKNVPKSIKYNNPKISAYPLVSTQLVDFQSLISSGTKFSLRLSKDSKVEVTIPKINSNYSFINPLNSQIYKTVPQNFNFTSQGESKLEEDVETRSVNLSATHASSYINLDKRDAETGIGYIASISARHQKGLPMVLNISSTKEYRSYLLTHIPETKDYSSSYFILPPVYPHDKGLSVLLGSQSFSNLESLNEVKSASLYPIPYEYLTQIYLQKANLATPKVGTKPFNSVKNSLFNYQIASVELEGSYITLSQAYDAGWKAYRMPANSGFKLNMPFWYGEEIKDHFKVNNWQNGWKVDQIESGEIVVIYFVPQLLEYAGFVLLGGVTGYMFLMLLKRRRALA